MKNLQRTMLLYGVLIVLLCVMAMADHEETDVSYAVTGGNIWFDTATGTITDCDDDVTEVIIPDSINGITIQEIGIGAFSNCYKLRRVELPDTLVRIRFNAFMDCYSLEAITIPKSVKSIAEQAFNYSGIIRATLSDGSITYLTNGE